LLFLSVCCKATDAQFFEINLFHELIACETVEILTWIETFIYSKQKIISCLSKTLRNPYFTAHLHFGIEYRMLELQCSTLFLSSK
uniref:Ovule protein n=1 Tax=Haemonchus placei TaxID=6290 RepID=A0A0N4X5V4_HAEPC